MSDTPTTGAAGAQPGRSPRPAAAAADPVLEEAAVTRGGRAILAPVRLRLGPGVHGVIGPNGAGKTTLLRLLAGHLRDDAGRRLAADTALGRVAHDVHPAGRDVRAHLDLAEIGHPGLDRRLALAILADAGVAERSRTARLSNGQRQLLSAAVALASGAATVLLDEPFNGLDAATRRALRERIIAVLADRPGLRLVLTSHRAEDLAGLVDDLIVVAAGRVHPPIALDEARDRYPVLAGPADAVAALAGDRPRVATRRIGGIAEATLAAPLDAAARARAAGLGVTLTPLDDQALIDAMAMHAPAGATP